LVTPTIPSFIPIPTPGAVHTPGGVQSFEYAWAVAQAFEFHRAIGKSEVERHTHNLASHLKEGLKAFRNVHLVTPMSTSLSAGIVCCDVSLDPGVAEERLRRTHRIVAMQSSPDADQKTYLRFSPSILNDHDQIDRTLEAMKRIGCG
jgi:selenocysteine lyase/cysteine desulfurase